MGCLYTPLLWRRVGARRVLSEAMDLESSNVMKDNNIMGLGSWRDPYHLYNMYHRSMVKGWALWGVASLSSLGPSLFIRSLRFDLLPSDSIVPGLVEESRAELPEHGGSPLMFMYQILSLTVGGNVG